MITDKFQDCVLDVSKNLKSIKKIISETEKELAFSDETPKFEKSQKLNQAYTLLAIDGITEILQVKPIVEVVLQKYLNFILTNGAALIHANEAYFNMGAIKFQTKGKAVLKCTTGLEAAFMIMGYALGHYYHSYPEDGKPTTLFEHGDSLLKLAKYFKRVIQIVKGECLLIRSNKPVELFSKEFKDLGFRLLDIDSIDETGSNFVAPDLPFELDSKYTSKRLVYNMNITYCLFLESNGFEEKIRKNSLSFI